MKVYTTDKIRNVVLLGHGGAGKTTLAEAMCYLAGVTSRLGKVEDGNTVSDFTKEEQKRGFSIKTSVIPIEWQDCKINILDTPGYFDFVGEVEEAISVADAAIIVVSGKAGVEVGTERAWDLCEKYNIPRMFFVTDMDIDNVSYRSVVEKLSDMYGKKIAPFNFPFRVNEKFAGYVNVIAEKAYEWKDKDAIECAVPDYSQEYLENYRDTLMETVAETSEEFMERYFEGDVFSEAEIRAAVRAEVLDGSIVPVEMGASTICRGVYTLLDDIVKYMPSPEHRKMNGINLKTNEIFEANFDFSKPKSAYIFKTIVDPFIGRYSLIQVRSGVFKTDDTVYDSALESEMRIGKLYIMQGNKSSEVPELHAGDIGAVAKLGDAKTGDTLSTKATPNLLGDILGDWREEVILHNGSNQLYLYTTTIPTTKRMYTLMHDPVYRLGISWQNTAYNQPPHLGFWLYGNKGNFPKPDITLVGDRTPMPAAIIKHGAGSSSQSITLGDSIIPFSFVIENADMATVEGLPDGVNATWDASTASLYFGGTPTVAGEFTYTITTKGGDAEFGEATRNGKFTIEDPNASTTLLKPRAQRVLMNGSGRVYDLRGRLVKQRKHRGFYLKR